MASLGAHTAVWTACWDEEGTERAARGAAEAGLGFLESFVHPDPHMTRLAALWREVSHDPEEPLREGLPFLREKAEEYGLKLR